VLSYRQCHDSENEHASTATVELAYTVSNWKKVVAADVHHASQLLSMLWQYSQYTACTVFIRAIKSEGLIGLSCGLLVEPGKSLGEVPAPRPRC